MEHVHQNLRIDSIKRKEEVTLSVNGETLPAYKGETILAALLAAGYKTLKKSPLEKKPRGALCGMGVCFECIVTVNGTPNVRSCMTEVENNMEISINA